MEPKSVREIARLIDHTLLRPEATTADIDRLCAEAIEHGFFAVCINPCQVRQAARLLHGTAARVATVVGFPLGANLTETKVWETRLALRDGAQEIDLVLNIGALKANDGATVFGDIQAVVAAAREGHAVSKVILETALLTEAEKVRACDLCARAGANFVKTATGFGPGGATVADVALLSRLVKDKGLGVKAAGGIRTLADLEQMVAAGATRIGTSSGLKILQEAT